MKEVILKLTDWEIANFHLKQVTILTFFEGEASIEFLQSRLAMLLTKNPWLTSRIIKEENKKAVPAMVYTPGFEVEQIIEDYFKIYDSNAIKCIKIPIQVKFIRNIMTSFNLYFECR